MGDAPDPPTRTGIICLACRQPVAVIVNQTPHTLAFVCPGCGHGWSASAPGTPKHPQA